MDTVKLRYFSVIAQTESVRKAADILKVTPSALSKVVKQLEEDLEVNLFKPLGRGIVLTREGRELYKKSATILDSVLQLKDQIRQVKEQTKTAPLRIVTFETFSTHFLQALESLDIGDRKLLLYDSLPGELEHSIAQGRADFGITYIPVPTPQVEHIKITSILMGVYKRRGCFTELAQQDLPFVVPALPLTGTPTRARGLDGWPEDAYQRKVKFEVTLIESAMELARQGKCAGYFPSFIVDRHNQKFKDQYRLERHAISKNQKRCYSDVYLVKPKDRAEDRDTRLISKLIRMGTRLDRED